MRTAYPARPAGTPLNLGYSVRGAGIIDLSMKLTRDQLTIYLHDHLAGSTFGVELAQRAARQNKGEPYGAFLSDLAKEIAEDRATLDRVARRLGAGRDELKIALAWTSEKVGRLKLNGRVTGYAPLSRVIELEGLMAGVQGKLALWQALHEVAPDYDELDATELNALIRRAERQLSGLGEQHLVAVRDAFGRS
jgi:hypothetical protein